MIISRNVVFQEEKVYKDLFQPETATREEDLDYLKSYLEFDLEESSSGGDVQTERNGDQEELLPGSPSSVPAEIHQSPPSFHLARDRERRVIRAPQRFDDEDYLGEALYSTEDGDPLEPETFAEAMADKLSESWREAMREEMKSQEKNKTWSIVERPEKQRVIGSRWIFKYKAAIPEVESARFKARLVAKGYSQREGIDYHEIYAPVVKHVTIRVLLAIVVQENLELEQLDVKTAFLYGDLEEKIYMQPPEGYEHLFKPNEVCLLHKSLYGLKQSPRQWNAKFDKYMEEMSFVRSQYDHCAYSKVLKDGSRIYLLLYVDDMLVAAKKSEEVNKLKRDLSKLFEMKDLGPARRILGIEIERDRVNGDLWLSQDAYLKKILEKFNMSEAKSVSTPLGAHMRFKAATEEELASEENTMKMVPYASAVGSLIYSMVCTRPDLAYSVGVVSRFMSKPLKDHWQGVKWILRYIKGSLGLKLHYSKSSRFVVAGYCDADFAADPDKRRSISGLVFTVGGNTVSWKSGLQRVVALSTTESEYMALTEAVKEAVWLKGLLSEFGYTQDKVAVNCDSQSAIALSKNNVHHERTKHIDVKLHYIRDIISGGEVDVVKISTERNPADIFTKVLATSKFKAALDLLQVRSE